MKPLLPPRNPTPRVDPKWLLPLLLWALMGLVHAQSGVRHADVERELKQTRYEQVLDLTHKALTDRPRDPQMRFWRAVALDKLGRGAEALDAYRALTQDHPELPEPHNNLGVMLLRAGHIDEAQAAFESALRMDAGYAAAMENLGDVLILQARRLYEQSLQTDARRPALRQEIDALPPLPSHTTP